MVVPLQWVPTAAAADLHLRLHPYRLPSRPTAGAVAVTTPAIAPPMATLWTAENRPLATTLPMSACMLAAIEPNGSEWL